MSVSTRYHGCAEQLRRKAADAGTQVTVSITRWEAAGPYATDGFRCPHGVTYWIYPTHEQVAQWAKDGVR